MRNSLVKCTYNYSALLDLPFSHNFWSLYFKIRVVYTHWHKSLLSNNEKAKSRKFHSEVLKILVNHNFSPPRRQNSQIISRATEVRRTRDWATWKENSWRTRGSLFPLFLRQRLLDPPLSRWGVCAAKTAAASLHSNNIIPRDGNMAHVRASQYVCDSDSWC